MDRFEEIRCAAQRLGGLDVLVNNAGVSLGAPIEQLTELQPQQVYLRQPHGPSRPSASINIP